MIKLMSKGNNGRPLYAFGLSAMNIAKLQAGQPIFFNLEQIGGSGDVVIFFGETEDLMIEELTAQGLVGLGTLVMS